MGSDSVQGNLALDYSQSIPTHLWAEEQQSAETHTGESDLMDTLQQKQTHLADHSSSHRTAVAAMVEEVGRG